MKIQRVIFALDANPVFQPFWPLNAELYSKVYGIRPTLCFVGTAEEFKRCNPSTEYGDVVRLEKRIPYLPEALNQPHPERPALTTLAVLHGPTIFPDEVVMTSGLDQFPLSRAFFNHAEASDAEMLVGFAGVPEYQELTKKMGCRHVPTSHLVGLGSTFAKVLGSLPDWGKDAPRMWKSGCPVMWPEFNNWGIDEAFFSRRLWAAKGVKIDLFSTEFWEQWKERRLNRPRSVDAIDFDKLKAGWYSELHSMRKPFPEWTKSFLRTFIEFNRE